MTSSQQAPERPLFNFVARAISIIPAPRKNKLSGGKKDKSKHAEIFLKAGRQR